MSITMAVAGKQKLNFTSFFSKDAITQWYKYSTTDLRVGCLNPHRISFTKKYGIYTILFKIKLLYL